jgi:hypothetical protein
MEGAGVALRQMIANAFSSPEQPNLEENQKN